MSGELNNVLNFLQTKHIKMSVSNEWLRECCNFYISSNTRRTLEELQNFVYEQWLLADLREIGERCLPPELKNSVRCTLNGTYAVQVNQVLNIGESCYSQLKYIRSGESVTRSCEDEEKTPDWQPKRNRTLKLNLTDGRQDLFAVEFESIAALEEPFIPGFKILLVGPVECRQGVILLKSGCIQILGGEADSLLIDNATENILARKLNLEQNPNPFNRELSSRINEAVNEESAEPENNSRDIGFNSFYPPNNDIKNCHQRIQASTILVSNDRITQDRDLQVTHHPNWPPSTACINSWLPSTSNRSSDLVLGSSRKEKSPKIGVATPMTSNKRNAESPPSPQDTLTKSTKTDTNTLIYAHTSASECKGNEISVSVRELQDILSRKLSCFVVCVAEIAKLVTKPRIKNDKWHVTAEIQDDTAQSFVLFSDTYLHRKIFRMSAYEVLSQKDRMATNPAIKEQVDDMLKIGVHQILTLHGQFHMQIIPDKELPVIIDVTDVT